jgi:hypothetical protein
MANNPYTQSIAGPVMTEQSVMASNPDILGLEQQKRMAQLLLAKAAQGQPEGRVVGSRYVEPSWAQRLSPILNQYLGQQGMKDVEAKQLDLAKKLREQESAALADYMGDIKGKPATPDQVTEMAGPYTGNIPMPTATIAGSPAVQGNPMQAYMNVIQNSNAPDWLKQQAIKKLTEGPMKIGAEDVLLDPTTLKPIYQGAGKLPATLDVAVSLIPNLPRNRAEWTPEQIKQVENKVLQLEAAKASVTHVNLPTEGERKAGFMANILDSNLAQMQKAYQLDPKSVKPNVPASIVEAISGPNVLSRNLSSAQRQIVEDSQLDVLDAALTLRTGAAYTKEQLKGMKDTYFPRALDPQPVIDAKKARLEALLNGAYIASGRATPKRESEAYNPNQTPPTSPAKPQAQIDPALLQYMTPEQKALFAQPAKR